VGVLANAIRRSGRVYLAASMPRLTVPSGGKMLWQAGPASFEGSMRYRHASYLVLAALLAAVSPAVAQFQLQIDPNQRFEEVSPGESVEEAPADDGVQRGEQLQEGEAAPQPDERVSNPVAEFTGVDKITGRIITFDVYVDETVQFGALQVTPRVCYSRPGAEAPKTDSFVEVDEITLDRKIRRIFTGWMFAESPGLNAVEHAIYDVWLKACKKSSDVPPPEAAAAKK